MYFLNNCRNRQHQTLFGNDAFFDFGAHGTQEKLANDIQIGDACVVASYDEKNREIVNFSWFTYSKQDTVIDDKEVLCRVFRGDQQKLVSMPKAQASKHSEYSCFFDKLGRFKQVSIVNHKIA